MKYSNPEKEEKSTPRNKQRVILSVGDLFYYGGIFDNKQIIYVGSSLSALAWLENPGYLIEELWISEWNIPFDSWMSANFESSLTEPQGSYDEDARLIIKYVEEHLLYSSMCLKKIRILTKNPIAIQYTKLALENKYEICLNGPRLINLNDHRKKT